ncbi:hypothetical protein G5V59_15645 [Nocardioides sp. W3-2-3]|nr:hypothetical protein [Nocardioides convexus]
MGAIDALGKVTCAADAGGVWSGRGTLTNEEGVTRKYLVKFAIVRKMTSEVLGSKQKGAHAPGRSIDGGEVPGALPRSRRQAGWCVCRAWSAAARREGSRGGVKRTRSAASSSWEGFPNAVDLSMVVPLPPEKSVRRPACPGPPTPQGRAWAGRGIDQKA